MMVGDAKSVPGSEFKPWENRPVFSPEFADRLNAELEKHDQALLEKAAEQTALAARESLEQTHADAPTIVEVPRG